MTRSGVCWAIGSGTKTGRAALSFASPTGGTVRKSTRYVFAARSSFNPTTSAPRAGPSPSTSTRPDPLMRAIAEPLRDALPDFAVHLRFQRLWRGEPEVGPKRLLPGGDLRIDSRADAESVVLPGLELSRDEVREGVTAGRQPRAHPARPGGVACDLPDRPAPFLVRMPMADLAEEAAEAGVAERPIPELRPIDRASGGEDLVHGPPQRPGGLKAHASRNTLTSRLRRTIAVTATYVRSRSSAKERKLSTTRATGVKIISRIPRFR